MEERFALDNNNNVIDFEDKTDKYCLSQEDVCNVLNKQHQRIAELEQDLEFTTKTANELIEIKHKLEQELEELKEKYIIPKFQLGQTIFTTNKPNECIYELKIVSIHIERSEFYDRKFNSLVYRAERIKDGYIGGYLEAELFATEQEAQEKLKEIQGNE